MFKCLIEVCSKVWQENLIGDGPEFHQYQWHEQLPLTSTHWKLKP
jgi:hypothetical protein